jgi:undecaprenyl diphosphate synthase
MKLKHIAFIVDGNTTWAIRNKKRQFDGYKTGMKAVANAIVSSKEFDIEYVTFYIFSSENWYRAPEWIFSFMKLAKEFLKEDKQIKKLLNIGAKLKIIGNKSKLDSEFQNILHQYEEKTKDNNGILVQLAISYGGRDEIVRAIKKMKQLDIDITEENISNNLDTAGIPDPQLIIRTGNKQRLSNFLLWQAFYSELYFTEILWPDFDKEQLRIAIEEFNKRKMTYGR